jgi:hypothetical protein
MTDDVEWDPDWWKKEQEAKLERQAAEAAAASGVSAGDTFLIVTEGTVTEPIYFELFLETLELSRAVIVVIPGKASHPRHVINTARDVAKRQIYRAEKGQLGVREPASFDHVWAVIDTDVAVREGIWNEVTQLATSRDVKLAHSTPCFEYWMLLHIVACTTRRDLYDGTAAKHAFKEALGMDYSTNEDTARAAITTFIDQWPKAVESAEYVRQYHLDAGTQPPANPSTEVDLLARALNDSAPSHLRRLKVKLPRA